jgi:acetyl/propionyl-CoA carboxylase alpha subunit
MNKLLIANRGEIVLRIIRASRDLGIRTVAVYSDADKNAPHVREADEAYHIGGSPPPRSYLNIPALIDAVNRSGADAVHPGYGFLAENAAFARAVVDNGTTWVGPPPEVLAKVESKSYCRQVSMQVGVPVVPGTPGIVTSADEIRRCLAEFGAPLLLKLDKGGGGKGILPIHGEHEVEKAFEASRSMGRVAFGSPDCYVEKRQMHPRHVEIQFVGDHAGNFVALGERECSVQRRYQKVIEESPSPVVTSEERKQLSEWTVRIVKKMGYRNAGTVEFLRSEDGQFRFIEVNARIQVEHPVTEFVTGVDIVKTQLRIAAGETVGIAQDGVKLHGHAIQARVYAEDPASFLPSPGTITKLRLPDGSQKVRVDHALEEGLVVSPFYDPMLAKVIVWGSTRERAIDRLKRKLEGFHVTGVKTTIPLVLLILSSEEFERGRFHTDHLVTLLEALALGEGKRTPPGR